MSNTVTPCLTRRQLLQQAAGACLGVSFASQFSPSADADDLRASGAPAVIYLFMSGGMSHIDTLDPKPGTPAQGPVSVIDSNVDGIQLTEYMPRLAENMHDFVILRSMTTEQGAHRPARKLLRTSYAPEGHPDAPSLSSWCAQAWQDPSDVLNRTALINPYGGHPGAGCLDPASAPLQIADARLGLQSLSLRSSTSAAEIAKRMELSQALSKPFRKRWHTRDVEQYANLYNRAVRLTQSPMATAFDISLEPEKIRTQYGESRFGQGCLLARRLVERGFRFVEVVSPGWDTHADNFSRTADLAGTLDQSLAALRDDLKNSGLWESTLVVVATEFGRTPEISQGQGRQHNIKAFSSLLGGGAVVGGQVHGKSDSQGFEVSEGAVSISDLNATIAHVLKIPASAEVVTPDQQVLKPANDGTALRHLLAT